MFVHGVVRSRRSFVFVIVVGVVIKVLVVVIIAVVVVVVVVVIGCCCCNFSWCSCHSRLFVILASSALPLLRLGVVASLAGRHLAVGEAASVLRCLFPSMLHSHGRVVAVRTPVGRVPGPV